MKGGALAWPRLPWLGPREANAVSVQGEPPLVPRLPHHLLGTLTHGLDACQRGKGRGAASAPPPDSGQIDQIFQTGRALRDPHISGEVMVTGPRKVNPLTKGHTAL